MLRALHITGRHKVKKIVLVLAVALVGCAAAPTERAESSGVMKIGQDTFMIQARAPRDQGGQTAATRMALTEANAHCDSMGREISVDKASTSGYSAQFVFQCLPASESSRPTYKASPDVSIEVKR